MKSNLFFIAFCAIIGLNAFTQQTNSENKLLQAKINQLDSVNEKLSSQIKSIDRNFSLKLKATNDSVAKVKVSLKKNMELIQSINQELGTKISSNETNANQKIQKLDNSLSKNTLHWIIAVLAIALLSIVLFVFLRNQLSKGKLDLSDQIKKTKSALEEEGIRLDTKLIELLETQMKLIKEEQQSISKSNVIDHELALKVADEIIRIQKNLINMNSETKGLKQLSASIERIQDNFKANGYEIVDMLNKPYEQGMKVIANFKPDEKLKSGEQIITRIIKPQVNFNGVMIQSAQIEVSQGE